MESWVREKYKMLEINTIRDLSMKNIAQSFEFGLIYHHQKSNCIYEDDFAVIFIDERRSIAQQRAEFFHEMAHVLRHYGVQEFLPDGLNQLQESQAYWFSLHASMPTDFLEFFYPAKVDFISTTFQIPRKLAKDRLNQHNRKMNLIHQKHRIDEQEARYRTKSYDPEKWTDETWRLMDQLKRQTNKEVINYVGLLRGD